MKKAQARKIVPGADRKFLLNTLGGLMLATVCSGATALATA